MPFSAPVATFARAQPLAPPSSPFMNRRSVVPRPEAALKNALTGGRSAEHRRLIARALAFTVLCTMPAESTTFSIRS